MSAHVQFLGATVLTLALLDVARRWSGGFPERLAPATDGRRELLEVAGLSALAVATIVYGVLVARDIVSFNPAVRFAGLRFPLYFFASTASLVVLPVALEVGVRERSFRDLGVRLPVAWWPALLLVAMGVLRGAAPLAFGVPTPRSAVTLLLALYSPVLTEELFYRGVLQSKLERVAGQQRAWVLAGVLFGLSHVPNDFFGPFWVAGGGDPLVALLRLTAQTAMGLLLGLLYAKSRTLAAPVLAHYFSNSLAAIVGTVLG
jgi:membrane protease YdiL (CAAX protease family)